MLSLLNCLGFESSFGAFNFGCCPVPGEKWTVRKGLRRDQVEVAWRSKDVSASTNLWRHAGVRYDVDLFCGMLDVMSM